MPDVDALNNRCRHVKLIELEPRFMERCPDGSSDLHDDVTRADGVIFLCPTCFASNNGRIGTHSIICWQPHVPSGISPSPGRWRFSGTGYADLTLGPDVEGEASSVLLTTADCGAHFHVTNGEIK